jgi:hypothetical protein
VPGRHNWRFLALSRLVEVEAASLIRGIRRVVTTPLVRTERIAVSLPTVTAPAVGQRAISAMIGNLIAMVAAWHHAELDVLFPTRRKAHSRPTSGSAAERCL